MNIFSIIMLVVTILTFLGIAGIAVWGFFRGWKKSVLILCRTVLAALFAFFAVLIFCSVMPADELFKKIVEPFTGDIPIFSDSDAVQTLVGTFVYTVVMPFIFSTLFIILNLLFMIPFHFIGRVFKANEKKRFSKDEGVTSLLSRFGSSALRIVNSLIIIMIVLLPLSGIIITLTDGIENVVASVDEQNIELPLDQANMQLLDYNISDDVGNLDTAEVKRACNDMFSPVSDNVFIRLSYSAPMRALCNGMTKTSDSSGSIRNEVSQLFDVAASSVCFLADLEDYGEAQKDAVADITAYISDSELHSSIISEIIASISKDVLENNKAFGADMSKFRDGDIVIIVDPLLNTLSKTTSETVRNDFNTLRDVLIAMIDYKIPYKIAVLIETKSESELIEGLANEDFLYELINSCYSNESFRDLTAPVINYVFTVVIKQFDADSERVNVAENISDFTDDELRSEATTISNIFLDAGKVMDAAPALLESNDTFSAIAAADMSVLGRFLNNARNSIFIGNGVNTLMVKILETNAFDSMRGVADILIRHLNSDEELDMENLFSAIQQFAGIIQNYESTGEHDNAELVTTLRKLNETLSNTSDPKTVEILKEIINDRSAFDAAMLTTGGGSDNQSAQKVLTVFIDKLASGDITEEDYDKEAKAVDYTMKLVKASADENSADSLKAIYGDTNTEGMKEMIRTMADSKIASAALIALAYVDGDPTKELTPDGLKLAASVSEEDKAKLTQECETYYKAEFVREGCDTAQLRINLKATAAILGKTISDAEIDLWETEARAGV